MRYTTHICTRPIEDQDQIFALVLRLGGWSNLRIDRVEYTVPQDRDYLLYLLDSSLRAAPHLDYYYR